MSRGDLISRSAAMRGLEEAEQRVIHGGEWPYTASVFGEGYRQSERVCCRASTHDVAPLDRLGDFGKLFMDYRGCPRGPMGRLGGIPIEEEVLYMKPITDVDGGRWIPANADALHELVSEYKRRAPAVHGHWIEETFITYISAEYDEYGDVIPRQCITNKCSVCGRYEPEKEPYCNCGARMDGEADA